ncbi:MAG: restriction endonuclease subunit S [Reyranella sp.]|nr:restriction endonuclease subunit S [Reyranella sp.]MDP3158779.1 restriction endonuclease subunit S [Reyranella sp.]
MSEANYAVPKLRFPQFTGPWLAKRGSDAFTHSRERGVEGLPIYSVTIESGMVRRDSLEREIGRNASDEANLRANKDDIVYNMMRMWQGAVGRAPEDCMVSPAYVVLSPKPETSPHFFEHWFKRARSIYWLWAYSYGLTGDRLRLYFRDFAKVPMHIPLLPEQEKIADFLGDIDQRIVLLQRRQEALELYKKGSIQRIFSRVMRFSRDDGSTFPKWEPKKLADIFDWVATNNLSREMLTEDGGEIQNIHYGDIHGKFAARFRQEEAKAPFIKPGAILEALPESAFCQAGDVVIADASEDYADIGKAIEILEVKSKTLVSGLHTYIARPKPGMLALGFSGYLFQTWQLRKQIMRIAQGISVLGISKSNLSKLVVNLPRPDEQRKIADFLSALDDKVASVALQVRQMQALKTALLQKMFV